MRHNRFQDMLAGITETMVELVPNKVRTCAQATVDKAIEVYHTSQDKAKISKNISNKFTRQVFWLLAQPYEQILEAVKTRYDRAEGTAAHAKIQKIRVILKKIWEKYQSAAEHLHSQKNEVFEQLAHCHAQLIKTGKEYSVTYLLPTYALLKASLLVSKQIVLEMLENRLNDAKIGYRVSKDTVTMVVHGQFDSQTVINQLMTSFEHFKQVTFEVVRMGLQIKISKKDLFQNYQFFLVRILEIFDSVKTVSRNQLQSATAKTVDIYQTVMRRIKAKQIEITTAYLKKPTTQTIQAQLD